MYLYFMSFLHIAMTQVQNISSYKTRTYLFYTVNIIATDDLATQWARASTNMILTKFNRINLVSTRSGLIFKVKYPNEIEYKMALASEKAIDQVSVSYFALKWLTGWNGRHMEWQERYLTGGNPQSIWRDMLYYHTKYEIFIFSCTDKECIETKLQNNEADNCTLQENRSFLQRSTKIGTHILLRDCSFEKKLSAT